MSVGKHLPVPLGYSVTPHCPQLQEPTKDTSSQKTWKLNTWEVA